MKAIFRDCIDDFIVIYLDKILIYSDNREDHLKHPRLVLSRPQENELYVGKNTNELIQTETDFSGLRVGHNGVRIGDERKKMISKRPTPTKITELCRLLGLAQFYRRFIKDLSKTAL